MNYIFHGLRNKFIFKYVDIWYVGLSFLLTVGWRCLSVLLTPGPHRRFTIWLAKMQVTVFCNLIIEVTFNHFYHLLFIRIQFLGKIIKGQEYQEAGIMGDTFESYLEVGAIMLRCMRRLHGVNMMHLLGEALSICAKCNFSSKHSYTR